MSSARLTVRRTGLALALALLLPVVFGAPVFAARYVARHLAEGRAPTVSADGRQVWFWARAGTLWQLYRCGTDGSGLTCLTGPGSEWPDMPGQTKAAIRAVSVSASGSTLVAAGRYALQAGASPADLAAGLTDPPGELLDALVTRDGTRVVALAKSGDGQQGSAARLIVGSPAGSPWATIWEGPTASTDAGGPRVSASANGSVLALVVGEPSEGGGDPGVGRLAIWERQDDGVWAPGDPGLPPAFGLPCLSADGERLAYVSGLDDTRILTFDRARGTVCSIATDAGKTITSLAMDDFGRRVVACAGGRVYYASFTGHTSHEVADLSGARWVSLSADGDVLAAETSQGIMLGMAGDHETPPGGPSQAVPAAASPARGRQTRTFDEVLADLYRLAQRVRYGPERRSGEADPETAPRPTETGIVATDPGSGWQLYEHAGLGLRVLVPPGWHALEESGEDGVVLIGVVADSEPGSGAATAAGQAGVRITLAPPGEDDLLLVAQEAMSVAEMDRSPSRGSSLLSGATAVRLEGSGTVDGSRQQIITLAAAVGGRVYCAAALTPASAGPRTREWVRRVLQSLTVMP